MGIEWVKETLGLIAELEKQKQSVHDEYEKLANQLMDLELRIQAWREMVDVYMKKHNMDSLPTEKLSMDGLANKSYPDMLISLAKQSNGILNVSDATEILLTAGISNDRKAIAHNISNSLIRLRPHFVRIGRGKYRFTNNIPTDKGRERQSSGVRQAVKKIKEEHPEMTNWEVVESLKRSGFDFKGKRPINAVNMALAYLGYSNKQLPTQQTLIGVPSIRTIGVPSIRNIS